MVVSELLQCGKNQHIRFDIFTFYLECVSSSKSISDLLMNHLQQGNPHFIPGIKKEDLKRTV